MYDFDIHLFGSILLIGFIVWAIWLLRYLYGYYIKKHSLAYFGIDNVNRVAKYESDEWREQIFNNGYMTIYQWNIVLNRQIVSMSRELGHRKNRGSNSSDK